ncbi:MAG: hypothetical protein R3263_01805, partial [Myxococcota bacterium]|nr:hypothetical protein [Myxococcota bacterium]
MLYRHSEIFRSFLMGADLFWVTASWALAYVLRFHVFPPQLGWDPDDYAWALAGLLPVVHWTLRARGLYEPQRTGSLVREMGGVVSGLAVTCVLLLAADAALRSFLSRAMIGVFFAFSTISVIGFRLCGRGVLRHLRRQGYNLRYLLVVGAGELAEATIDSIHDHPEAGLRVIGVLSGDPTRVGRTIQGVRVLGGYESV